MKLNRKQRELFQYALLDAFPTHAASRQMVYHVFEKELDAIALGGSLQDIVFKLIRWAESSNQLSKLISEAYEYNPNNQKLKDFVETFFPFLIKGDVPGPTDLSSPYRGLFAFQTKHEAFFYGRETFTQQLYQKIHQQKLVVVLGASGSGKSSVVFAGLVPGLIRERNWVITDFRPGDDPFKSLMAKLLPLYQANLDETGVMVRAGEAASYLRERKLLLKDVVANILAFQTNLQSAPPDKTRLLLIADQFEELYTLCSDQELRKDFLTLLLDAVESPGAPVYLVLTLRADFMSQALEDRLFSDQRKDADLKLEPMTPAELRDAIIQPAESLNINFERGLAERVLTDVKDGAGSLPLLEFALTALWNRRTGNWLGYDDYEAIGGVRGALTRHAEETFFEFNQDQQIQVKRIFTQLVNPGQGTEDTRRLATRSELQPEDWTLTKILADHHLVVTDKNEAGLETVEIVHEALIQHWQRLRAWIEEDRAIRVWQEQVRSSIKRWQNSNKSAKELLPDGELLVEAKSWLSLRPDVLTGDEKEYINESLNRQEKSKRNKLIIWFVILLFILTAPFAGYAVYQWQRAEVAQTETDGLRLALASANQSEINHELALLLAIEAVDRVNTLETNTALRRALLHQGQTLAWLTEHTEKVQQIVWSPANTHFLTSGQKEIKIWDAQNLQLVNEITIPRNNIRHLIWTLDGQAVVIATTGEENTVQIWPVKGQKPRLILPHSNEVNYLAWHPDGELLATAGQNRSVAIWDINQSASEPLFSLEHEAAVEYVGWNKDGSQLVTLSDQQTHLWHIEAVTGTEVLSLENDGRLIKTPLWDASETYLLTIDNEPHGQQGSNVYIWDAQSGAKLKTLAHTTIVNQALWNKAGTTVLTAGADGLIRLWDVEDAKEIGAFTGHQDSVLDIGWNEDETQMISSSKDGTVRIWKATGEQLAKLTGHQDSVNQAIWDQAERRVISVSDDQTIRIWNPLKGSEVTALIGHEGEIRQAAWSPDSTKIVTASQDETAKVWDPKTGTLLYTLPHEEPVNQALWSPSGQYLVTVSNDDILRFWDAANGNLLTTANDHKVFIKQAQWYNAGAKLWLVTASEDRTARLWSLTRPDTITLAHTLAMNGPVNQAIWNETGTQIATVAFDANNPTIRVWDVATGERISEMGVGLGEVTSVDWHGDDGKLVTAGNDENARIWDVTTGKLLTVLSGHTGIVNQASWQPGGDQVITASDDGTAIIWNTIHGTPVYTLIGHQSKVNQVNWNPTGTSIVTASDDRTARIWDATNGQQVAILSGHTGFVNQANWDRTGRRIVTVSDDGTARVYYVSLEDLRKAACDRAVRNMSQTEWAEFIATGPRQETCP